MMNHFLLWLKEFYLTSKDKNFKDFRANYLKVFTRFIGLILCVLQGLWFLKDMLVLQMGVEHIHTVFLSRFIPWIFIPLIFSPIIKERNKWIICLIMGWLTILSALMMNCQNYAASGLTGEGWITYYLLFFLISLITSRQGILHFSYLLYSVLVIKTSTQFGGPIQYGIPILRPVSTGLIITLGLIFVSLMVRASYVKLFVQECELKDISKRDSLTGVYNRAIISDLVDENESLHRSGSIFIFDIDKFKSINDNFGHIAGDDTIVFASKVLKSSIRKCDTLIRYGGDEFLIITDGVANERAIWDKILEGLKSEENIYHITFSAGSCRGYKESIYGVIKKADGAAYTSKFNGRNQLNIVEEMLS